eukprot:TRINITY_DN3203_c0_g1_i1.p1 TRINITY_DN3203_c0_g1~~TRINITY_DN3203_c0_g1_i1.p1  ORF type:complete len:113 (+),score=45.12 TRINITY_DN3203_c0_g1_i1:46-339(+)
MLRSLVGSEMCIRDRSWAFRTMFSGALFMSWSISWFLEKASSSHSSEESLSSSRKVPSSIAPSCSSNPSIRATLIVPVLCVDTVSYTHLTLPTKRIV